MVNEINNVIRQNSTLASNENVSPASSDSTAVKQEALVAEVGKNTAAEVAAIAAEQEVKKEQSLEQVTSAVAKLSNHVQNIKRELNFSINDETGDVVIKVIDSETDQLIRSIPSEEWLKRAEFLNSNVGNLLQTKV